MNKFLFQKYMTTAELLSQHAQRHNAKRICLVSVVQINRFVYQSLLHQTHYPKTHFKAGGHCPYSLV